MFIFLSFCIFIQAEEKKVLTLSSAVIKLKENLNDYKKNVYSLKSARASYLDSRTSLYPSVDGTVPVTVKNNSKTIGTYIGTDYTINNSKLWVITPELSLSQYLPTGGTFRLSVRDALNITGTGSIDPESLKSELGGTDFKYQNTPGIGISLTQPVFFGDAYGAGKRTAENTFNIAKKTFLLNENTLAVNMLQEYFNLKFLKYSSMLIKSRLDGAKNNNRNIEKMFKLGRVTRLELLQTEAALKKAEIDLFDAEEQFANAKKDFLSKYGYDKDIAVGTKVENICDYSILRNKDDILNRAMGSNIGLLFARYNLNIVKDSLINTRYTASPVLNLAGNIDFSTTADSTADFNEAFKNSFNDNSSQVLSASIGLSAKLFDAGSLKEKINKAQNDIKANEYEVKSKRADIIKNLNTLFRKIEKSRKINKYSELNIQIAEFRYEKGKKDLELGRIAQNDLNKMSLELENAKLALISAKIETNMDYINILLLEGKNLIDLLNKKTGM